MVGDTLQLSPEPAEKYIGDSASSKTFKNPVPPLVFALSPFFRYVCETHDIFAGRILDR